MPRRSFASRFDSGSSSRNTAGLRTSARPSATRWRWPPESCAGLRSSTRSRSSIAAASRTRASISARGVPRSVKPEREILRDRHVRIQRVVLEHHRDVAIARRHVVDDALADRKRARRDRFEPGDHAQQRRLAAAGRPDQHEQLAVDRLEARARDGDVAVGDKPCAPNRAVPPPRYPPAMGCAGRNGYRAGPECQMPIRSAILLAM